MIILGIDPGLARVGYGVIEVAAGPQGLRVDGHQRLLDCGMIRTDPGHPEGERMVEIASDLRQLIRAWQIAIPYMGVGDTIEIAVPAELGYGARGAGPIPPAATLFFTIELLDVMVPPGR